MADAAATKPTIVFVPGAWHVPESYDLVATQLKAAGYATAYVSLPSVGASPQLKTFAPDIAAIRAVLLPLVDAGKRVVLVAHSYGSLPANEALQGLEAHVAGYVFMSAFVTPVGVSLMDALQGKDLPWFIVSPDKSVVLPDDPATVFYNDLDAKAAAHWVGRIRTFSYQMFMSPTTYAAYKHVPSTFLFCTRDNAIPLPVQQLMVKGSGAEFRTETFEASHSPQLSQPEGIAKAIRRAAGETLP